MSDTSVSGFEVSQQMRLVGIVLAVIVTLLAVGYFLFLRLNYGVLYHNLNAANAASVVAELESRQVKYKVKNGGATILVPAVELDSVRLSIVEAAGPLKNLSGFELFNESEMGLTEFAQKIKYQRALQGELARTIIMMDGIENARVHIAVPERALFRSDNSMPKAAVTIVAGNGFMHTDARIIGIQRLVAAAVPGLTVEQVVVLNSGGEVISLETEVKALEKSIHVKVKTPLEARIFTAISQEFPNFGFNLTVLETSEGNLKAGEKKAKKPQSIQTKNVFTVLVNTDEVLHEGQQRKITNLVIETFEENERDKIEVKFGKRVNIPLIEHIQSLSQGEAQGAHVGPVDLNTSQRYDSPSLSSRVMFLYTAGLIFFVFSLFCLGLLWRAKSAAYRVKNSDFALKLKAQLETLGEDTNAIL